MVSKAPRLDIPRFSMEERALRWGRVRDMMRANRLDCLVASYNTGHWGAFQGDVRYLTGMGGNDGEVAAVFPLEGEVTAVVRAPRPQWAGMQDWVSDIRGCGGEWAPAYVKRLKELGLDRGTIGVVSLGGYIRAGEGTISYAAMEGLKRGLPEATFVNATEELVDLRSVKSEEEIGVMRRSSEIAQLMTVAMKETARPGVSDALVYAAAYNASMTNGGELPTLILWSAGAETDGLFYLVTNRPLEPGDMIATHLEATYMGYRSQVVQPLFIQYAKEPYREMVDLSVQTFNKVAGMMRPGVSLGELMDAATAMGKGTGYGVRITLTGAGVGEDPPLVVGGSEAARAVKLQANNVFIMKPNVSTAEPRRSIDWGDTVVVREEGLERLGSLPQGCTISA